MTASTQPTETTAQTTDDTFRTDVSHVRASVERAAEILERNGEPLRIGRLVGTALRIADRENHRVETYTRIARQHIDEKPQDTHRGSGVAR